MSQELLFEVQVGDPLESYQRSIWETQAMLRGDLYPDFGGPLRATQHSATGFSNVFGTAEATLGEAFQATDGLGNIGAQLTNNLFYGEVPWQTTQNLSAGVDVIASRDVAAGRDVGAGRNLTVVGDAAIGDDLTVSGDLAVSLTSTLTGNVGIGGAPDGTVKLKNTGAAWFTGDVGIKVTPSGDFGLEVADDIGPSTDNARDLGSATKQWRQIYSEGLTVDSPTLLASAGKVGFGITPTVANEFAGIVAMDYNGAVPTFYLDSVNHWLGVLNAVPAATLDVNGVIRATGTMTPASGVGLELLYNAASSFANILAFDRTGGTYKNLRLQGLDVSLRAEGVVGISVTQSGGAAQIGVFANAPAAQQADPGVVAGTADATYGTTERDMLNDLVTWTTAVRTALRNYGWLA